MYQPDDFLKEEGEKFRDEQAKEKEDEIKAHDVGEDYEKRCLMCGDALMIYNNELIIDGHCPYCAAKEIKDLIKQKRGGILMENQDLVAREPIVLPQVTTAKALEAFKAYQDLAKEICTNEDIQRIGDKDFKKKSFWRKCQRFFNLSLEKIEERREKIEDYFVYHFIYRATAPNGAFVDGAGSCSSDEKGLVKTEHNTRAIAETRAKNRAIADLVAFGEVTAEEIVEGTAPIAQVKLNNRIITVSQRKRLWAICKSHEVPDKTIKEYMFDKFGYNDSAEIKIGDYENICTFAEKYKDQSYQNN